MGSKQTPFSRLNTNATNLDKVYDSVYRLTVQYPQVIFTSTHYIYWNKSASGECDCSTSHCSNTVTITPGYKNWPNVGPPNCHLSDIEYTTDFPSEGKYYMCVSNAQNERGWAVQTTVASVATNISIEINPPPVVPAAATTKAPVVSSSAKLTTLFAVVVAVVGAF